MKEKSEEPVQLDFDKKNSILELWKVLKDSTFNVLFVMLDRAGEQAQSMLGIAYQSGIDFIQMFVFPFNSAIITAWNGGDTLNQIANFFYLFNISTYLPSIQFSTFLIEVYTLIFVIVLLIVDIVYVSYSFSKKKFRFTWPLVLLASIVPLFVTVLFIPITQVLFSVVNCNPSTDNPNIQYLQNYPDVICWQGWHLFHAVVTLAFTSIFVFISSVVALAMFEPRMSSGKLTARTNSNAQIAFIVNKIVCQFFFNFTPFSGTLFYCLMLFSLSGWMFWNYNIEEPYYDKKVSKFFRICSAYYFWTNSMLMASQLLQNYNFDGGLVAWLGGLPFIGIIIIFQKKSNIDKLFSSDLKFKSGEELEDHLKYVLLLIQTQHTDKNSYMLLIGYIQKHKEICSQDDCPLRQERAKKDKDLTEMEQNCKQLLKQIERMYLNGLRKYPNCTKLRLSYAFFQLERNKNKAHAYEQFVRAEKINPNFEQQFIIYRFKKIIKENLQSEQQEENESDLIEIIRFDNHVSLCQESMLISARLHKQFWAELKEEVPDLKKMNKIGSRIIQTVMTAKQNFIQIRKINSSLPEVLYNYAIYLLCVVQDTFAAQKLLEECRKIEADHKQNEGEPDEQQQIEAFEKENIALIIVSASEEQIGKVQRINLLFTELSGYFKQEIVGRKVEKLLPSIYRSQHNDFMHTWSKQCDKSKYLQEQHQAFLKQKSGLLIPINYKIIYNPLEQIFMSHFYLQNNVKNYGYVITDFNGMVTEISASIYSYFNFSKEALDSGRLNIDELIENAIVNEEYYKEKGKTIEYEFNGDNRKYIVVGKEITTKQPNKQQIQSNDENQKMIKYGQSVIGYEFRIEKIEVKQVSFLKNQLKSSNFENPSNIHSIVQTNSEVLKLYQNPYNQEFDKYDTVEQVHLEFVDYGVGIKQLRLTNNEVHMIYIEDEEDDFEGDFQQSEDQQGRVKFDDQRYAQVIKKAINTNFQHVQIQVFRWLSFLGLVIIIALLFVQLVLTTNSYDSLTAYINNNYNRIQESVFLNDLITSTLQNPLTVNFTNIMNQLNNHTISFTSSTMVNCLLQDNSTITKRLYEGLVLLEGRLTEFYANTSAPNSIIITYINYLQNFYPVLYNYTQNFIDPQQITIPLLFALLTILSVVVVVIWIIVKLKIEKKRFDILIWFLDIPIPYVTFLNGKCDKYLKSFVDMKHKNNKEGEDLQETQFDTYLDKKQGEQELQQQQKTRKNLINRHKKRTFISKLDNSYAKYCFLVVYFSIFTIFNYILVNYNINTINFLRPQYENSIRDVYRVGIYEFVDKLITQNYTFTISNTTLPTLANSIQQQYLDEINKNSLKDFNLKIVDFSQGDIVSHYANNYFQSLCINTNDTVCLNLLGGSVNHGMVSVNGYIFSNNSINLGDLFRANTLYIQPAFLSLLQAEADYMLGIVASSESITSLCLYIYTILTVILFLSFWLMYLRNLNIELNQTIQMLNMIPLKVLPNSNKETKRFIRWIITESNKLQHKEE